MNDIVASFREAQIWCGSRLMEAEGVGRLRSPELFPGDLTMHSQLESGMTERQVHAQRANVVHALVSARARALRGIGHEGLADLEDGRLVLFDLEACFFDGVACIESGGFFDESDLPPWDTWVAFNAFAGKQAQVLLSWVPGAYVDAVGRAMKAHFVDGYRWLDEEHASALVQALR